MAIYQTGTLDGDQLVFGTGDTNDLKSDLSLNLQEVTDNGAITTNSISVQDISGVNFISSSGYFGDLNSIDSTNCFIIGKNNSVSGTNSLIVGNNNNLTGTSNNIIIGNYNDIQTTLATLIIGNGIEYNDPSKSVILLAVNGTGNNKPTFIIEDQDIIFKMPSGVNRLFNPKLNTISAPDLSGSFTFDFHSGTGGYYDEGSILNVHFKEQIGPNAGQARMLQIVPHIERQLSSIGVRYGTNTTYYRFNEWGHYIGVDPIQGMVERNQASVIQNEYYLTGIEKSGNSLIFLINDPADVIPDPTFEFGSAAFASADDFLTTGTSGYLQDQIDNIEAITGNYLTGESDTLQTVTDRGNITTGDIGVSGDINVGTITMLPPPPGGFTDAARKLYWDEDVNTLSIGMDGEVTLQVGQEQYYYVKAAESISNGDVIYASGVVGGSSKIVGAKYIANNTIDELYVLGVATQDIANGEFGYVTEFGSVRGIVTTGQNGETWNEGDILYASPTVYGGLTNVQPIAPNLDITMAIITNEANNGAIFVRPTRNSHLDELHDVHYPTTPSENQLLRWGASGRWENVNLAGISGVSVINSSNSISIAHNNTSSQSSVNNSNGTVIQDVTLDEYGHVSELGSVNLDSRYYTESEVDSITGTLLSSISTNASDISALESLTGSYLTTSTTFSGDVSGPYNNIVIADDSHNHIISNVDGLQTALDGKLATTGKAADSDKLDGLDSSQFLRSDASDTANGNITFEGTLTFNGVTNGIYHSVEEDHYYFDSYGGERNIQAFLKTQRSDIIKYRPISDIEYWNGSSWLDGSSQLNNIKFLLDGREDTAWNVPSTYYKFRFTVDASAGWPTTALIGVQLSWSASTFPGYTLTIEEQQADLSWQTRVTANFTSANGISNWGTSVLADYALHTGRTKTRITIDFYGWNPSNPSYTTIPLKNIFIYSNFTGSENNDYHNLFDYDRNIVLPNTVKASNIGVGTDNSVVILDSAGFFKTDEIDSRVWGSTLVDGNGTANYVSKWSDGNTLTNSLIYDNGTNIGIGTTSPFGKFHIKDNNPVLNIECLTNDAAGGKIRFTEVSNYFQGAFMHYDASANVFNIGVHHEFDADLLNDFNSISINRGNKNISFNNADLYLDYVNNRVGIGTTTPSEKLHVNGNAYISGTIYANNTSITSAGITTSGYLRGPSSFVIDPSAHGDDSGTVVIAGNLQVDGTTTTVNSTTVNVGDKNIVLGANATSNSQNDGAGLTVTRPEVGSTSATIAWNETNDEWDISNGLTVAGNSVLTTSTTFGGDVSGTYNNIVVADDSHNHSFSNGDFSISGALTINGSTTRGAYPSASQYHIGADNIVLKGNASGISSIFFESEKDGTNINHSTDFGFIQFHSYGTSTAGESNELIIGVSNDADDNVILNAPNANGLKFRIGASETDYNIWHAGNDGAGSSLDADLLDGQHGSYYAPASSINGTDNYVPRFSGTSALENSIIYDNGTNVGIGTTSPTSASLVINDTNISSLITFAQSGTSTARAFVGYDGSAARFGGGAGKETRIFSNDIQYVTIQTDGDVGIGTTTPGYKLEVNGSFAATTKSFVIDHPTKEGKRLRYASLEGPENGVYIRGKSGAGIIELPEYWEKLVDSDSVTVTLTPIGKFQPLYVISQDSKKIEIGGVEGEYNYVIYGERIDVEKLIVEVD